MPVRIYRYGEAAPLAGLCIGVTRLPPRGVPRRAWSERGLCDIWLPNLAPSRALVAAYRSRTIPFATFAARYRREMKHSDAVHLIEFLAVLATTQTIHLGCFCADPALCHRSVLHALVLKAAPRVHLRDRAVQSGARAREEVASRPCLMPEVED